MALGAFDVPVEEVCPAHGEQSAKMTISRFDQGGLARRSVLSGFMPGSVI